MAKMLKLDFNKSDWPVKLQRYLLDFQPADGLETVVIGNSVLGRYPIQVSIVDGEKVYRLGGETFKRIPALVFRIRRGVERYQKETRSVYLEVRSRLDDL